MSNTKDRITIEEIYTNIIRCWLIGILLYIPFVTRICNTIKPWNSKLSSVINRLDEFTIVLIFPLAIIELYKTCRSKKTFEPSYMVLFLSISVLGITGVFSGMLNGNDSNVTALGTFAYVKYFLIIFIYAAFFKEFKMFLKVFRVLLGIAVVIGIVAFIQEINAIVHMYFLKTNNAGSETGGIMSILAPYSIKGGMQRIGVYRASSLLSHYNLLGLYSLFILTIYLHIVKKVNLLVMFSLLSGIVASVSRVAYLGFALLAGLQLFKRKWFILLLIPVGIALFFMGSAGDNIDSIAKNTNSMENINKITYREYAGDKAYEVWKDHPLWGVGPGMFGGAIAFKFNSFYYTEYNFEFILNWFHSLDQLWPQVLAEIGIIGVCALAGVFCTLLLVLFVKMKQTDSDDLRGLYKGTIAFTLIFLSYTLSGNLNIVSVMLPYCAFIGISLGCNKN